VKGVLKYSGAPPWRVLYIVDILSFDLSPCLGKASN